LITEERAEYLPPRHPPPRRAPLHPAPFRLLKNPDAPMIGRRMHASRMHCEHAILGFLAVLSIAAIASCSSVEPAPWGGHVEYAGRQVTGPSSSAQGPSPSSSVGPLSPLDWAIRKDCPPRPWSKNVPERACTKDSECGDGFCDRDHCAAIWTCNEKYGQRCYGPRRERSGSCDGLCIDGRCRTCLSDAECVTALGIRQAMCNPYPNEGGGRTCLLPGPKTYSR